MKASVSAAVVLLATTASAIPAMAARGLTLTSNPFANPTGIPTPASPNPNDPRFSQWKPAGPNDKRAPCPGLNSLANHGFIHRDGRNMTIPHLVEGLAAGMNIGPDFSIAIGGAGILSSPNPLLGAFDLSDLDEHNFPIEHDASLSRRDAYFGNDYSFYQPNWDMILDTYGKDQSTSITKASQAKLRRTKDSNATNPTFTYGPREAILSYGETALYLQTMSDSVTSGVAPLKYVRSLFEQERLPYNLGWRPNKTPITLLSLGSMAVELVTSSGETLPEGAIIVADTFKDAFEGIDPLTGFLGNISKNGLLG